jgi:hypothetical protein
VFRNVHKNEWTSRQLQQLQTSCATDLKAWDAALSQLAKEGKFPMISLVLQHLQEVLKISIDSRSLNHLLEACSRSKDPNNPSAQTAVDAVQAAGKGNTNQTSFKLALMACGNSGDAVNAKLLLELMRKWNIPRTVANWNSVLNAVSNDE